jgi:hypothetical protein
MNGLSLRINSSKSDEVSKKMTQDLLEIEVEDFWPEGSYLVEVSQRPAFNFFSSVLIDIKQHLRLVNTAVTTENQIKKFRSFAKLVSIENDAETNKKIVAKLMSLYFQERVKHPAKSTIQR